ncbi:MAG: four-helix bundle copper-binding protein, partial [Ktedonobacteraceae bacterium]
MSMSQVEMQQSIQDCLNCQATCTRTAEAYKQTGGEHASNEYIYLLVDCAQMCMTAARFMQHNSPLFGYPCQATVQVATHCAGECDRMGDTDCANACRICASSCEQ